MTTAGGAARGTAPVYRGAGRFLMESAEGLLLAPAILLGWPIFGRRWGQWGSTTGERTSAWVGDTLIPDAMEVFTRAVDIAAPPETVWRWVVQFGLGRAGFYSYELFERLVGIDVKNVESILPDQQTLSVGDEVKLHQSAPGIRVALVEPGRHLCFGDAPGEEATVDPRRSWSLYLKPTGRSACRLLVRSCIEGLRDRSLPKRLGHAVEAPIDFLMEQRMLRTIRRLAEEESARPATSGEGPGS